MTKSEFIQDALKEIDRAVLELTQAKIDLEKAIVGNFANSTAPDRLVEALHFIVVALKDISKAT